MNLSGKLYGLIALLFVGLLCVPTVAGQSTATLSGTITDPSGAVVPNATVLIHSQATGIDRSTVSDEAGSYNAPSLQPGTYSVTVTASGFARSVIQDITLAVDAHVTVNAKLALATTGETVEVQAGTPQIESQTITVGQVIDRNTVQEIPLNGRHFLDLTVLTPGGVVAPTTGNLTSPSRGLGANSFITAGNREDSVNFQINGVNLNDMVQNQITFQPSIDTTSEFKINNSTFSAEYGRSSGSIVNVSTRSGTNSFHGEAFDYFRNEYLDARNYFNRNFNPATGADLGVAGRKAPLKRNNFGGAFGGPIWKNRTFFFGSYEGLRQHQGILQNGTVFSPAQRAAIAAAGKPAANSLLALIPLPNSGNNYVAFTPGPVTIDQYTVDISHQFSANDQIHGFYAFQRDVRTEPNLQGNTIPGFGDHRNAHRQVLTINQTHVFNPNLVNEARLGMNRISIAFNPATPLSPADYHLNTGGPAGIGIPQIVVSDINLNFGGPQGFPQGRHDTFIVFSNATTWLKGRHSIKFGGEYRRFINDNFTGDTGLLTYASTLNNFAQDTATGFTIQPTTISSRIFINAIGAFVQDNFKLTPRVTLEYGLRFEWNGTPTEGANRFVIFDPSSVSLIRTGTHGVGSVYKQNYNVEPRLGFAYDIFGTSKSVLRGAYGYLVDQPTSNVVTGLASNPPFNTSVNYTSSTAVPSIPVSNLYNSAAASGIAINSVNPSFRNGSIQSYNLNFQQELKYGIVAQIGYYGSVGRHLRGRTNQNEPVNGVRPFTKISSTSPISANAAAAVNYAQANSVGSSNYNAMWLTATKNFSHGLQFNMTYDYSKSMDTNSLGSQGVYTFQTSYNPGNNYGPSDFDTRHHYSASAIYALPFKGNRFVEGYQLSTIVQYQTGNPVNVTYNNSTYTGVQNVIRPNLVGPIVTKKIQNPGIGNVSFIQSTVCPIGPTLTVTGGCSFQNQVTQATPTASLVFTGIGNMSRNKVSGPGFANVDLSGEKDTKITERVSLKLRVDAFDIFNHPNFSQPTAGASSNTANTGSTSNFGQISSTRFPTSDAGSSRQLQISGKIVF